MALNNVWPALMAANVLREFLRNSIGCKLRKNPLIYSNRVAKIALNAFVIISGHNTILKMKTGYNLCLLIYETSKYGTVMCINVNI